MFYLPNGNSISRLFCAFKHFNEDSWPNCGGKLISTLQLTSNSIRVLQNPISVGNCLSLLLDNNRISRGNWHIADGRHVKRFRL